MDEGLVLASPVSINNKLEAGMFSINKEIKKLCSFSGEGIEFPFFFSFTVTRLDSLVETAC